MSQKDTLFGLIAGAAIVGATLAIKDVIDDPEKSAAVRAKINAGCRKIKAKVDEGVAIAATKVGEVSANVRAKVSEGYADLREKAGEAGETIRAKVENARPVQKIKKTVEDIRRKAEPASPYFREEEELDPPVEAELPAAEEE